MWPEGRDMVERDVTTSESKDCDGSSIATMASSVSGEGAAMPREGAKAADLSTGNIAQYAA